MSLVEYLGPPNAYTDSTIVGGWSFEVHVAHAHVAHAHVAHAHAKLGPDCAPSREPVRSGGPTNETGKLKKRARAIIHSQV
jgi:hypothetical protein